MKTSRFSQTETQSVFHFNKLCFLADYLTYVRACDDNIVMFLHSRELSKWIAIKPYTYTYHFRNTTSIYEIRLLV